MIEQCSTKSQLVQELFSVGPILALFVHTNYTKKQSLKYRSETRPYTQTHTLTCIYGTYVCFFRDAVINITHSITER